MLTVQISTTTIQPTITSADEEHLALTKTEIVNKIHLYADKYNVSFQKMYQTVDLETGHTFDSKIQSKCKYTFSDPSRGIVKGTQERSYGAAQIHLPDHPGITREQAEDIDFALEFMAKEYSLGHNIWYAMK